MNVRLSHLSALGVMIALAVALFAIQGVQAQAANKVIFSDSDAVVKAGTDVEVKLILGTDNSFSDSAVTVTWWRLGVRGHCWHYHRGRRS